jgi:membrane protein required for colicin V production
MIWGVAWPDYLFGAILAFAIFKGYARGFVKELGGLIAAAAALIAPWYYNGAADGIISQYTELAPPFAHTAGMIASSIAAYLLVSAIVLIIGAIVTLPVLGFGNKLAGALVGFIKGYVFVWVVLFIALFFPLTPAIRASLHVSRLAPFFTAYDTQVDAGVLVAVPTFAKPFLQPYFERHHV